jgi:hypothetical protein
VARIAIDAIEESAMRSWVLAAGLLAAITFVPMAAYAADVDDDDDRGTYNDPRRKTPPPAPGYNDQDDDDDRPAPGKKYSGPQPFAPPGNNYSGQNCARSEQVRQRLVDTGWRDFQDGHQQGEMVVMKARRPSGRLFELTLHRCSGQVVEVRPMEGRPVGPYAFNRPYNYDRPPPLAPYGPNTPYRYDERWPDRPYGYGGGPRRWWWYRD